MMSRFLSSKASKTRHNRHRRLFSETLERRELLAAIHTDENWGAAGGGAKDLNSGLVWSDARGLFTYASAATYAANLVEGGFDDWRLPTLAELDAAIKHGVLNHVNSSAQEIQYWTSTKGSGNGNHWTMNAAWGTWTSLDGNGYNAIAVRGTASPVTYTAPKVRVYSQDLDVSESGHRRYFSVVLDKAPTANVSFSITSTNTAEGTSSISAMTFTPSNWNVPQKGMVQGVNDIYLDPNTSFSLVFSNAVSADPAYNGLDVHDIAVINKDNEQAIQLVGFGITSETGATSTVDVRLGAIPQNGSVQIALTTDRPTEGTVPETVLVFDASNWDVTQSVVVTGVTDGVADGDQRYRILASVLEDSSAEFLEATASSGWFRNVDIDGTLRTYSSSGANNNVKIASPGTSVSRIVVPNEGLVIGDLNVKLNINHPKNYEIQIALIGPDGTRVGLYSESPIAGGSNFVNTVVDEEADRGFMGSAGPYTGTFYAPLGAFDQKPMAGTWTLEVKDNTKKNVGTILNWSLQASLIPPPPTLAASVFDAALLDLLSSDATKKKR